MVLESVKSLGKNESGHEVVLAFREYGGHGRGDYWLATRDDSGLFRNEEKIDYPIDEASIVGNLVFFKTPVTSSFQVWDSSKSEGFVRGLLPENIEYLDQIANLNHDGRNLNIVYKDALGMERRTLVELNYSQSFGYRRSLPEYGTPVGMPQAQMKFSGYNTSFKIIEAEINGVKYEIATNIPSNVYTIQSVDFGAWTFMRNWIEKEWLCAISVVEAGYELHDITGLEIVSSNLGVVEMTDGVYDTLLFMANGKMVELPPDHEVVYEQGKGYAVYSPSDHVTYYDGKGKVFSDVDFVGHFKDGNREVDIVKASFDGTTITLELSDKPHTLQLSRDESRAMLEEAENKGYFKMPGGRELKTSGLGVGR